MLQRSPTVRNGHIPELEKKVSVVIHKVTPGSSSSSSSSTGDGSMVQGGGYRKWGLLCSFLVTATLLVVFMCQSESRSPGVLVRGNTLEEEHKVAGVDSRRTTATGEAYTGNIGSGAGGGFQDTVDAFRKWDDSVGCSRFRSRFGNFSRPAGLQDPNRVKCEEVRMKHVTVHVKEWTWIPDNLENLYSCSCGLTCLWTKSGVLADNPDAMFYEWIKPPLERKRGEPLRIYIELESGREKAPSQDVFVSYHHSSDVQATYAGASFHNARSYFVSPIKNKDTLVYWSSSRCLPERQEIASQFLRLVSHHSFGKCLNNVGEKDVALDMYPECRQQGVAQSWNQHLHCAMSHYKFALAIENTMTESYVTEKLFYALDAGAVPIYFGAPNVLDLVPPNSIIQGDKFSSMQELAKYVKEVAEDPIRYAEFHAWRRCGVTGNYYWTRAVSLDSLPCRLCAHVSKLGGKN